MGILMKKQTPKEEVHSVPAISVKTFYRKIFLLKR